MLRCVATQTTSSLFKTANCFECTAGSFGNWRHIEREMFELLILAGVSRLTKVGFGASRASGFHGLDAHRLQKLEGIVC